MAPTKQQRVSKKKCLSTDTKTDLPSPYLALPGKTLVPNLDFSYINSFVDDNCCLFFGIFLALDSQEKYAFSCGNLMQPHYEFMSYILRSKKKTHCAGYNADDIISYLGHLKLKGFISDFKWENARKLKYPHCALQVNPCSKPQILVLFGRNSSTIKTKKLKSFLNKDITDRVEDEDSRAWRRKLRRLRRKKVNRRDLSGWEGPLKRVANRELVASSLIVRNFHLDSLCRINNIGGGVHGIAVKFLPSALPLICDNKYKGETKIATAWQLGSSITDVFRICTLNIKVGRLGKQR